MGAHIYFYFIFAVGNKAKTKTPYNEFTKANRTGPKYGRS